jgi:uncharacterized protein (DUF58 family)
MLPHSVQDRLLYIEICTTRAVRAHRAGDYLSRIRGRGFEFDQHKPYQRGDDYRQIDWNVTARMPVPFVKREFEEKELSTVVMVDLSRSTLFASTGQTKKDLLLEAAATLAFSAVSDNMSVGLLAFTDLVECWVAPKKGKPHVWRLLDALWNTSPLSKGTDFEVAWKHMAANLKRTALILCLSDFIGRGTWWTSPYLKTLVHRADFLPVIVEDAWEQQLPETRGFLRLRDTEEDTDLVLVLSPSRCREYQTLLQQRRFDVRSHFYALNLDHLVLRAGEDFLKPILAFFAGRKRKRS